MSIRSFPQLKGLEGRQIGLALSDGSRMDDCQLVSAGRPGAQSLWVFCNGVDAFIPLELVLDVWEVAPAPSSSPVCAA
jgi:hypothetical protein